MTEMVFCSSDLLQAFLKLEAVSVVVVQLSTMFRNVRQICGKIHQNHQRETIKYSQHTWTVERGLQRRIHPLRHGKQHESV